MANARSGFVDAYHASRLNHVGSATSYPAALTNTYLGLYVGVPPLSDGSGGTLATGTRPAITFGTPQTDGNGRQYITNTAAVTNVALTGVTSPGAIVAFGIFAANTGGTPVYWDKLYPFEVQVGTTPSFGIGSIRLYAEPPTI